MSSTFHLYITDEAKFPQALSGTDADKYEALVNTVTNDFPLWETLELSILGYMMALEAIGILAGSENFFAVLSFNNSPHNLLGDEPDIDGSFGYFTPQMVVDAFEVLQSLVEQIENYSEQCAAIVAAKESLDQDILEYVFYRYLSTFEEAASRGHSITVIHE